MKQKNKALEYIINIKHIYNSRFGSDTLDLAEMIRKLDIPEYNNFAKCVNIVQKDSFALITYSLIKGGDSDLYTNSESIIRDLRGTLIDMDTEALVLLPFRKFFNIDEIPETALPLVLERIKSAKTIEITDKLDGSMISMTYYKGRIVMAGTGSIDPRKNSRLIEAGHYLTPNHEEMIRKNDQFTFMFELIGNEPQIVKYSDERKGIYLIGARGKVSGDILTYHDLSQLASIYDIPMVEIESHTFEEILALRGKFGCLEKEGWVLRVDDTLYKVKCEDFINMHRLSCTSPNGILNLYKSGKLDDLKPRITPAIKKYISSYVNRIDLYVKERTSELESIYSKYRHLESTKDFALSIKDLDSKTRGYLFCLRKGQPLDFFRNIQYSDIETYLKERNK